MRILQINKYYYPDIGGVETVVAQYAHAAKSNHTVQVLCVHKKFKLNTTVEDVEGISVIRCSSLGTFMSMPISISFYVHFFKLYRNYDVFHFHEPFPLASVLSIFLNKSKKIIVTWHSDIIKQKALKKLVEYFQIILCKKATVITTTSPNLLSFSSVIGKYRSKVKILPLGIDIQLDSFTPKEGGYILYLGRLSYYKGINVLLDAYNHSKTKKKLIVVGDGDREIVENIRKAQKGTQKDIVFINKFVSEEEKKEYLKNCLFFVFPSIEPSEAFGIIQLEAMVYGKPIINTNLPTGVPFVSLNNETGITVEPSNMLELSNAIDKLSLDSTLRNSLGANAAARVAKRFSNPVIMKNLMDIYREL